MSTIRNMIRFYCEELLAPRPTSELEDHPLSALRVCLFNISAATLHIGGRSSIRNLRTHHAIVTGTNLSHGGCIHTLRICNTYWFSTATVITRTRLNITLILTLPVLFVRIVQHTIYHYNWIIFKLVKICEKPAGKGAGIHFFMMIHTRWLENP